MDAIYLYHITHIENLPSIIEHGKLFCDLDVDQAVPVRKKIAYANIKARRAGTPVTCGPGGFLSHYVPFHFGPRSPMLLTVGHGNVPDHQDGQERIVHLVTSVERIVQAGLGFVYSDGHPIIVYSSFFEAQAEIAEHVDLPLMSQRQWADTPDDPDRKRRRQAEFLVYQSLPWNLIGAIGVINDRMEEEVKAILANADHKPQLIVRRDWDYD